ncbi:HPr family phosphocarrier protein [Microbaculum marinum]|uniref:HPr family phosphocarrier protein n=1 Tax=Microbaculum marinum TaxID=1764581 RepID=A0AAW9S1K2_9HYPH
MNEIPSVPGAGDRAGDPLTRTVEICNQRGLHARASAKFVKLAGTFDARVTVTRDDQTVAGTSIMGLLVLGAAPGCRIEIAATGPQARAAVEALSQLVETRFGEE